MRIRGRHYRTGEQIELTCSDGKVTSVGAPTLEAIDAEAEWVSPGFFDLNVSGLGDKDVDGEKVGAILAECVARGVTAILVTLSGTPRQVLPTIRAVSKIIDEDPRISARILGFHLTDLIADLNESRGLASGEIPRLQDAAKGQVRLISLNSVQQTPRLVERLAARGIAVCKPQVKSRVEERIRQALADQVSLADAIDIGSVKPYESIGVHAPTIEVGVPVNFLLFNVVNDQIQLRSVLIE